MTVIEMWGHSEEGMHYVLRFVWSVKSVSGCKITSSLPNVQVRFVGEGAVDQGGPRREFFRLFASGSKQYFFHGSETRRFFDNNVSAVQVDGILLV